MKEVTEDVNDKDEVEIQYGIQLQRRKDIISYIYRIVTDCGSDVSAVAPYVFDGRLDLINEYMIQPEYFFQRYKHKHDNNNNNNNKYETIQKTELQQDETECTVPTTAAGNSQQQTKYNENVTTTTTTTTGCVPITTTKTKTIKTIDRIHKIQLSYNDFVTLYMKPNRPVIIQGLIQDWNVHQEWVMKKVDDTTTSTENRNEKTMICKKDTTTTKINSTTANGGSCDSRGIPNFAYIGSKFGQDVVPVYEQWHNGFCSTSTTSSNTNDTLQNESGTSSTIHRPVSYEMTLNEYKEWWDEHHKTKPEPQCTTESSKNDFDRNQNDDDYEKKKLPLLYLKDWKFNLHHHSTSVRKKLDHQQQQQLADDNKDQNESSHEYPLYTTPLYFRDDWLNFYTNNAYQFIYLGPSGSTTILHVDIYRSYSWSSNICGHKRWYFIPPVYTNLLYDTFLYGGTKLATHLYHNNNDSNNNHIDDKDNDTNNSEDDDDDNVLYPGLRYIRKFVAYEVNQYSDETVFVPSHWYHTVENIGSTLSINHNWLNRYNIISCYEQMEKEYKQAYSNHGTNKNDPQNNDTMNGIGATTHNATTPTKLEDDLLLMWYMVSKKANTILDRLGHDRRDHQHNNNNTCTCSRDEQEAQMQDLNVIQHILIQLQQLLKDQIAPRLMLETDDGKLIQQLQSRIKTENRVLVQ